MARKNLISNMGLFWHRSRVYWGGGRSAGHLKGYSKGAAGTVIDFREQRGIYVLYADFQIVYIGQAGSGTGTTLFGRLKRHTRNDLAERWDRFSWFGLDPVLERGKRLAARTVRASPSTETILNHIEGILIHACEPPLNRQQGSFGDDVERYLQWVDVKNLGLTAEQAAKDTNAKIAALTKQIDILVRSR